VPEPHARSYLTFAAITRKRVRNRQEEVTNMLRWAVIFFIISIVAAIFGFGGIASAAAGIAKVLFYIFVALFVIALVTGLSIGRSLTR